MGVLDVVISSLTARDIRFATSLDGDGSDAINDPDYSAAYVTITTNTHIRGFGLTFTCGRGTEIVCSTIERYTSFFVGKSMKEITSDFANFFQSLTQEPQLRWLGPEKGVTHLAIAAMMNALWDLWGRLEGKPVWKLLSDMEPEHLVSLLDFSYIEDALTKEEALKILREGQMGKEEREKQMRSVGYPAYTTSAGWLGYSDEKIQRLCKEALAEGFNKFKVKVGLNFEDDKRRIALVRKEIGDDRMLMTDANQRWGVKQAIDWMIPLAPYNITWIEEPTCPDDILGHATIAKALKSHGIGVATGEMCQNRIMFKQFLQAGALQFCQIDSCRLAGPNEIITVILMAKKFGIPVCPHAGGVGLCEIVQHLSIFDYICVSKTLDKRVLEYVDHLHEHFVYPVNVKNGSYIAPTAPGYSIEMKEESLNAYEYPNGSTWQKLFSDGIYDKPNYS